MFGLRETSLLTRFMEEMKPHYQVINNYTTPTLILFEWFPYSYFLTNCNFIFTGYLLITYVTKIIWT